MTHRFTVTVPLPDGEEERNAYICLPDSYFQDKRKRYPVIAICFIIPHLWMESMFFDKICF